MPIQINELIIKASVGGENSSSPSTSSSNGISENEINQIVDKIFKILEEKNQR